LAPQLEVVRTPLYRGEFLLVSLERLLVLEVLLLKGQTHPLEELEVLLDGLDNGIPLGDDRPLIIDPLKHLLDQILVTLGHPDNLGVKSDQLVRIRLLLNPPRGGELVFNGSCLEGSRKHGDFMMRFFAVDFLGSRVIVVRFL
jgi:hypothetical protein